MSKAKINILSYHYLAPEGLAFESSLGKETVFDVRPCLKDKKSAKFMSLQDKLSFTSAHQAWEKAHIDDPEYSERTGIYLCVGILPFEDKPLDTIAEKIHDDGILSMEKFSTEGFHSMNPLLTFKCLPNMPLFHISYNLGITGRYYITYPGIPDWFTALERAIDDLNEGVVDYAIVGASADQTNFLVENHIKRVKPELLEKLINTSAMLVLSTKDHENVLGEIKSVETKYRSFDPFKSRTMLVPANSYYPLHAGVVEPALALCHALEKKIDQQFIWEFENGSSYSVELEVHP